MRGDNKKINSSNSLRRKMKYKIGIIMVGRLPWHHSHIVALDNLGAKTNSSEYRPKQNKSQRVHKKENFLADLNSFLQEHQGACSTLRKMESLQIDYYGVLREMLKHGEIANVMQGRATSYIGQRCGIRTSSRGKEGYVVKQIYRLFLYCSARI